MGKSTGDESAAWRGAWARVAVSVVVALSAGCGPAGQKAGSDGGIDRPSDSGGAVDVAVDPDAPAMTDGGADASSGFTAAGACRAAIETQCRRQATCRRADVDSCVALVADFCPAYYFNSRSQRTVAEIEACLPALAQLTCTDIAMGITPPCLRRGTGAVGSACLYNTECEFGCSDGLDRCGTCGTAAAAATGEPCDSTHFCAVTDYCHAATRTCAPKTSIVHAAENQPCDFTAQPSVGCQGDLVCARTTATGTAGICRPFPQLGEPCAMTGDAAFSLICRAGLACDAQMMTCQVPPPPSGGCGDGGACDAASFCRAAFTAAAVCVPRAPEGQPCRIGATSAGPELQCAIGIRCALTPDAGFNGTCTRPGGIGDACDATHPCGGALCSAAGRCTTFDPAACQP